KPGVHSIARLARMPVPDRVGQDDEILGRIEGLARAEQHVGEYLNQKRMPGSSRPVHDQDGVVDLAGLRILSWRAGRRAVQIQRWERLSVFELEIAYDKVVLDRRGIGDGEGECDQRKHATSLARASARRRRLS